jgi:hypothetical protein
MSDSSSNLTLPYLAPSQAQKHVTVNDALRRLDAVVQLCVVSATTSAQPASPVDGAVYILPAGKTGATWGAMANEALAYWRDGAWEQITPREGWVAFVRDTDQMRVYDGAAWTITAATWGANQFRGTQTVTGESGLAACLFREYSNGAAGANFLLLKGRGTAASPAQTLVDDQLGGILARGITNSGAESGNVSAVTIRAAESFTSTGAGTYIEFATTGLGQTSRTTRLRIDADGTLRPNADNIYALGAASFRFSTVYAATGTINTSDAREKTALAPIPDSVKRAVRRVIAQIGVFQWLEAVERKGENGARKHVGVTAQAVRDAFAAEGEDPARWALFCEDALTERVEVEAARVDAVVQRDPETGEERAIKRPIPARYEERPVLDANGAPVTRLGVRADQLMWLALAAAG